MKQVLGFNFDFQSASYQSLRPRPRIVDLDAVKHQSKPVVHHHSASTWDIGKGVLCVEFHSKANTMDPSILYVLNETIKTINASEGRYKAMVIYNDDKNFSVGANLKLVSMKLDLATRPFSMVNEMMAPMMGKMLKSIGVPKPVSAKILGAAGNFAAKLDKGYTRIQEARDYLFHTTAEKNAYNYVANILYQGQSVFKAMREANFPVVAAPKGFAFGGGCEVALHCDAIQPHAETYMGLVEAGVGLIPGWGGHVRLLERMQNAPDVAGKGYLNVLTRVLIAVMDPMGSVSTSAFDAGKKHWLNPGDGVSMNKERQLTDAMEKALSLVEGYKPPEPPTFCLPGKKMKNTWNSAVNSFYLSGNATYHDAVVGDAEASLLAGGNATIHTPVTEDEMLYRERQEFMSLVHTNQTKNRVRHTGNTGKPLREGPLDKARTLDEMRTARPVVNLPFKSVSGQPLDGEEGALLEVYAEDTAKFYRIGKMLGMA
jgi:3-hydroxyacyl-CoA dehydrogenase